MGFDDLVTVVSGGREGDENHSRRSADTESRNHSRGSTHIRVERQDMKVAKMKVLMRTKQMRSSAAGVHKT
jgi:hypothetical protein